jgi:hypothetical protein
MLKTHKYPSSYTALAQDKEDELRNAGTLSSVRLSGDIIVIVEDLTVARNQAKAVLGQLDASKTVKQVYDASGDVQEAFTTLLPWFEYPNWSYRTVKNFLKVVDATEKDMGVTA